MTSRTHRVFLKGSEKGRFNLEIFDDEVGVTVQSVELVIENLQDADVAEIAVKAISSEFSTEITPL